MSSNTAKDILARIDALLLRLAEKENIKFEASEGKGATWSASNTLEEMWALLKHGWLKMGFDGEHIEVEYLRGATPAERNVVARHNRPVVEARSQLKMETFDRWRAEIDEEMRALEPDDAKRRAADVCRALGLIRGGES